MKQKATDNQVSAVTYAQRLYTAEESQSLDAIAIEQFSFPSYELMERAANAALKCLQKHWPNAHNVVIACGSGNNGGDGLVLARLLKKLGVGLDVYLLPSPERLQGDAKKAYEDAIAAGVKVQAMNPEALVASLDLAPLFVDAILGTGVKGELRQDVLEVVERVNAHACSVLALDGPTGLCGDTGRILGGAIRADVSITFIAQKQGFFTGEASTCVGELCHDRLALPPEVFQVLDQQQAQNAVLRRWVSFKQQRQSIPKRSRNSHKGKHGHVLLVGGDQGYGGAIAMAGQAALRSGAGLVSVACHPDHAAMVTSRQPELMCRGIEQQNLASLDALIDSASHIALGPGLGQSSWSQALFCKLMEEKQKLCLLDADALNFLAQNPDYSEQWVLTPHPGEAARLLSVSVNDINQDRFAAAQAIQQKYGGVCILKGAGSLIQSEKACSVCVDGNPGMASGGMGDVLSGVLVSLRAQFAGEMSLFESVELGVCLHSAAADVLAKAKGERGLLASDLAPVLRELVN